MMEANFTQVAEVDGRAVGVILGRTRGRRLRPWVALRCLYHGAAMALSGTYQRLGTQLSGYDRYSDVLDRMSGVLDGAFDAEVALFIVDKRARGCGVGAVLFERLNAFFREKGVRRYYLHTDSACSYGFYERKGLRRLAEVQTDISYAGVENIEMFVYGTERSE